MFDFNEDVIFYLKNAELIARSENVNVVDSRHLLLSILKKENYISNLLNKYGLNYKFISKNKSISKENYNFIFYSPSFKRMLDLAIINAKELKLDNVNIEVLFLSILEESDSSAVRILKQYNIDIRNLYKEIRDYLCASESLIYDLGTELTDIKNVNNFDKVIGREKEVNRIIEILARKKKNNPLLIGKAGVGKSAIVEELARRIKSGNVPEFLKDKRIVSINVSSLVSGTKYRGEFEEKLDKVIKELENSNTILFIDEIHTIVGAGGAEGAIDASNILKPALARGKIKLIGATTDNEYKKFISKDKALERRFDLVLVEEPNEEETLEILYKIKSDYEQFHNVSISESIINKIVFFADKYIKDKCEPDRSIDILDEVCALTSISLDDSKLLDIDLNNLRKEKNEFIKNNDFKKALEIKKRENLLFKKNKNNKKIVGILELKTVLESKLNIRIFELEKGNISKNIFNDLIGKVNVDNDVLKMISSVYGNHIKKGKSNRPTTILLTGNDIKSNRDIINKLSIVTKTNLIKVDFSEYKNDMSISRFIGSTNGYVGYDDNNTVFESLRFYPNSIILFENLDKAHTNVKNLIKSVLDTGYMNNSKGDSISFQNTFIVINEKYNMNKSIGFEQNIVKKWDTLEEIKPFINKIVENEVSDINKNSEKLIFS